MKTKKVVCIAALIGASISAGSWLGCQRGGNSTSRTPNEERTNGTTWEYKTVEKEVSRDPEQSKEQMRQQMQEFQREGWLVLSFSNPLPQTDGTIRRKYELKRAKK